MKLTLFLVAVLIPSIAVQAQTLEELEELCVNTGGTVTSSSCCQSVDGFPNTCLIGGCGCAPNFSHVVSTCECPAEFCFDDETGCVQQTDIAPEDTSTVEVPLEEELAVNCEVSGGFIETTTCCPGVDPFPDNCVIGACSCPPDSNGSENNIRTCACPEGQCFDGATCVIVDNTISTTENPEENEEDLEAACLQSGGTVEVASCCAGGSSFPNLCLIGACGCAPDFSEDTNICSCPEGTCFDGTACTDEVDSFGFGSEAPSAPTEGDFGTSSSEASPSPSEEDEIGEEEDNEEDETGEEEEEEEETEETSGFGSTTERTTAPVSTAEVSSFLGALSFSCATALYYSFSQ